MIFSENNNYSIVRYFLNLRLFLGCIFILLISACSSLSLEDVLPPPSLQQLSNVKPTMGTKDINPKTTVMPSKNNTSLEIPITKEPKKQYTTQIVGKIINGNDAKIPNQLPVTITGFNGMVETYKNTITINSLQPFVVKDVAIESGWFFVASIDWEGVTYSSDMIEVKLDGSPIDLSLIIYGTTKDTGVLQVDRLQITLEYLAPNVLKVIEIYSISNNSMKMLIPEKRGDVVVPFSLPKNAYNLQFQDGYLGERYIPTDYGFADTVSVPPGQNNYHVLYAFEIPYQQKIEFTQLALLPVRSMVVMTPVEETYHTIKVKSDFLQEKGNRKIAGKNYRIYSGESLSDGDKLQMILIEPDQITSLPKLIYQFIVNSAVNFRLILGAAILIVVLIMGGVWVYRRKQNKTMGTQNNPIATDVSQFDDPNELIDMIMALDDLYKSGELVQSAYQMRRSTLKMRLQEVINNG